MPSPSNSRLCRLASALVNYAWAFSIGAFIVLVAAVRLRLLVLPSHVVSLIFSACFFLYCVTAAVVLMFLGRPRTGKRLSFWVNLAFALLWAIMFYGTWTFPTQK